jgi:hypothetical protein
MLETGQLVSATYRRCKQMMALDSDIRRDLSESIEDGLTRKPDWKSLSRVKAWLSE